MQHEALTPARKVAVGVFGAAGLGVALWQLGGHYPVASWLCWVYLWIWLLCAFWALACLSAGHAVLRRLRPSVLPFREHLLLAFALGVLAFALGVFLLGVVGALGPLAFFALPLVMITSGARSVWQMSRRWRRLVASSRRHPRSPGPSPLVYGVLFLGALGVVALYLNILTPNNLAYDARWYHLALAEHYTAAHAIRRFPEGWFPGALPQLASLIYTWAFLLPGGHLFMHVELAAHLELVLFLATLAGIPLVVRRLLHGARVPGAWAALFLFPGIFIYDSTLSGAADHVLAFWGPPLYLATARLWRTWNRRDALLVAAAAAGAALTKYQALYLLVPVALGLGARAGWLVWRGRSARDVLATLVPGLGAFASLTAIHWLKNLVWYGDPVYPLLHDVLRLRPWNPDADPVTTLQSGGFVPVGSFSYRLLAALRALPTFAFEAHDWNAFHKDWPTFGFLFTLLLPFLIVLRRAGRIRALAAAALVGVFVWYWTFHQDRYLQALVPWMAAVVAAVIWRLWRAGVVARLALVPLVALQILWGGDHYAFPTHAMLGQQPMRLGMDMIADGFEGRFKERFAPPSNLVGPGRALPPGSKVLIHEQHLRLGIGVQAASDARGTQGALSYRRMRSPRDTWERLRALGVTHVLYPSSPIGLETYGDEAAFYDFAVRSLVSVTSSDGVVVGALPSTPPSDVPYAAVALEGCGLAHRVPLGEVDTAIWVTTPPPSRAQMLDNQRDVDFLIVESSCRDRFPSVPGFRLATSRKGWETWVRAR